MWTTSAFLLKSSQETAGVVHIIGIMRRLADYYLNKASTLDEMKKAPDVIQLPLLDLDHYQQKARKTMPTLETERLILRDFVLSDWDALNAFLSDPSVTRYMHFASWDEEKRRQWLASLVQRASNPHRDAYDWAITLRSNGLLIGWLIIGRSRLASEEGTRECGCGYALNQRFWGQGYMPEALQAAFTYAFTVLGTQRIYAECERENTASARVMQKCGMEYEGTIYDDDGLGNWKHRYRYVITAQTKKTLR